MKKVEVELEVITPMFSYGADTRCAEFRVTELKALMRTTFREVYKFDSVEDMKKKEGELFGDLEHKSPIRFKCKRYIGKEEEIFLPHKSSNKLSCFSYKMNIKFSILLEEKKDIDIYIGLLIMASILGGLGKRSRKGFGSFIITNLKGDLDEKFYNKLLTKNPEELLMRVLKKTKKYVCTIEKLDNSKNEKLNKFDNLVNPEECIKKYPYGFIKDIFIKNISKSINNNILKNLSQLTHNRLENEYIKDIRNEHKSRMSNYKNVLGNTKGTDYKGRFASPAYVTFWKNSKEEYLIVKLLNYKYELNNFSIEKDKNKSEYEIVDKYVDKYIDDVLKEG